MKLTTPFTILNQTFNEKGLRRYTIKKRKLATQRLHDDSRKIFKNKAHPNIVNGYI
tara:strand:+ start:199 stop:366 length:168 start_codon:yes stop_codon:yes gene_type:complete